MRTQAQTLAEQIHAIDFDHPFTLHPDGTITDAPGVYAPAVWHDDETDVMIDGAGWRALTGMTRQDGYHGAVMHASEYIGRGIANYLLDMVVDGEEPIMFVVVVVECMPDEDDEDGMDVEPAGWAILRREVQS